MSTPNRRKQGVIASVLSVLAIIVMFALIIQSGAYAVVARFFGLPEVTSISQLMPDADAQKSNDLKLKLDKPDVTLPDVNKPDVTLPDVKLPQATLPQQDGQTQTGVTLPAAAASPLSIKEALSVAQSTPTTTPHPKGYDRAAQFGTWVNSPDLCGNGTSRDYILKRDLTNVGMDSQCRVTHGDFIDPYTGQAMKFQRGKTTSSLIQIDHVVALNDAYASGLWKKEREADRVKYANDPDVLLASEGKANNLKGNGVNLNGAGKGKDAWNFSTPSVWLPDYQPYRCEYLAKRVYIKHKYDLTMSEWEKEETVAYLQQCAAAD